MIKKIIRFLLRIQRGVSRKLKRQIVIQQLKEVGPGFVCDQGVSIYGGESISIGTNVVVNKGVLLQSCDNAQIVIGNNVTLSYDVKILTGNLKYPISISKKLRSHNVSPIIIHDNVWVGAGVIILPGVSIGKNNIIAAGSIVSKNIDGENSVYGGIPAKFLKNL